MVPAMEMELVAPSMEAGQRMAGCPYSASSIRQSSILSSRVRGDTVLIRAIIRGFSARASFPPNSSAEASRIASISFLNPVGSMIALSEYSRVA